MLKHSNTHISLSINQIPITMKKIMLILLAAVAMLSAGCSKEKERGSIEVGKYADFVVLDKDVLEMEAQGKQKEIFKVNVANTWFEGKQVYPKQ